jgi:short-subunit dehydrogenase
VRIEGRIVLVTGASRGIGAATAVACARKGGRVLLLARSQSHLEQVAHEIAERGGAAAVYPLDLADPDAVERVAHTIKEEVGIPDIIINNAGAGSWRFTEETLPADMVGMMAVPYFAAFYITRAFLPEMLRRRRGHIVCVTSAAAYRPIPGATAYNAACWAVRGFAESLRADLHGTGLQVTLLASGTATTPGFAHYPGVEERLPTITKLIPLLTPEQVARALVRGIERQQRTVIIPRMLRVVVRLNAWWPWLVERLIVATGWKHQR